VSIARRVTGTAPPPVPAGPGEPDPLRAGSASPPQPRPGTSSARFHPGSTPPSSPPPGPRSRTAWRNPRGSPGNRSTAERADMGSSGFGTLQPRKVHDKRRHRRSRGGHGAQHLPELQSIPGILLGPRDHAPRLRPGDPAADEEKAPAKVPSARSQTPETSGSTFDQRRRTRNAAALVPPIRSSRRSRRPRFQKAHNCWDRYRNPAVSKNQ
jgi:hypothetical protein